MKFFSSFVQVGRLLSLAAVSLLSMEAHAEKTNFEYTTISPSVMRLQYADPVCISTGGGSSVCYSGLGGVGFGGSYQFLDGLLVVSGSVAGFGGSGYGTTLSAGASSVGLNIVKAIGSNADVTLGIASLGSAAEACNGSSCTKGTASGIGYMAGVKSWIGEARRFSLGLSVSSSQLANSNGTSSSTTSTSLDGGFYFNRNHELSLGYASNSQASLFGVSYIYHFTN